MTPQWHDLIFMTLPGIISLIVQPDWAGPKKFLVAIVVCFVASTVELLLDGSYTKDDLPRLFGKAVILCMASYSTIWKAWGASDKIETATSPGLPAEVTAVLEAKAAADKKAAEVEQVVGEAVKAREVVADAKIEAAEVEKSNDKPD